MLCIDPSFKRTGFFFLKDWKEPFSFSSEIDKKNLLYWDIQKEVGNPTFPELFLVVKDIYKSLISQLDCNISRDLEIAIEYPPPSGQWAPGLYMLDSILISKLEVLGFRKFYLVPPQAIPSMLGKRSPSKTDVVNYAKDVFKFDIRINHDIASAMVIYDIIRAKKEGRYKNTIYFYNGINVSKL